MTTATNITRQAVKLGDIASKITKGTTPTTLGKPFTTSGVNFIKAESITDDGRFIPGKFEHIDEETNTLLKRSVIQENDVLYSIAGVIGRPALVNKNVLPANTNQALAIIRLDPKVADASYVYYVLSSKAQKRFANNLVAQSAQPNINLEQVSNIEIPLPSLGEQKYIAEVLSSFDEKIKNNNRIIGVLEETAQVIFDEWFVKNSKESQKTMALGEVIELAYGKALKAENRKDGGVAVVGSSGIVGRHNEMIVKGPGIVVGRKGVAGSVIWVDEDFYPIDTTFYVKTKLPLILSYYLLRRANFIPGDSAVPGLNREDAYRTEIKLPSRIAMDDFQKIIEPMFAQRCTLRSENSKLAEMRDLLLPHFIMGEIKL